MNLEVNNQDPKYEISKNPEEIAALRAALFAFNKEYKNPAQFQEIRENIDILTDKINQSKEKLWLSLEECRLLVKIYSTPEFNNINPFVRKTVDEARKLLPEDVYKATSKYNRMVSQPIEPELKPFYFRAFNRLRRFLKGE